MFIPEPLPVIKETISLQAIIKKTERIVIYRFEKPKNFVFYPGQSVVLSSEVFNELSGKISKRVFSCASSPDKPYLDFCIANSLKPMSFTKYLVEKAKPHDTFLLEGPYGRFLFQQPKNPKTTIVFVAGGVGIAPLHSMIQALNLSEWDCRLFFSSRITEELLFKEEFEAANLSFVPILTRESKDNIEEALAPLSTIAHKVMYLCGPPSFVNVVRNFAKNQGFEHIYYEQWGV